MIGFLLFLISMWSERFFDYIVLRAEEFGLKSRAQDVYVFSISENQFYLIPSQIDEVEYVNDKKTYKIGDGSFSAKDELVFPARYCGDKADKKDISGFFESVFEVEVWDSQNRKYCYVGIKSKGSLAKFKRIQPEGIKVSKQGDEIIVSQDNRYSIFDNLRPVVKSIYMKDDGDFKQVFFGLKADIYIELLSLIKIRKTEQDMYAKPVFMKSGDVRALRSIRPYADIGFGIKIPGADTTSYIYKGFMYVENAVPVPFNLKYLSRQAYANIYLSFLRPKKFVSEKNNIEINAQPTTANEDGHMWGFIEGDNWSAAYFIKELSDIPIKRSLYYQDDGRNFYVGISLNILDLPKGEHKFALYGFFMPPGNLESAKRTVFDPLSFKIRKVI
ncbi:MAG: hypothetical protein RMJ45_03490 [Candidatus Calescibacterium sp.]|nr:hypothetical protein [Candidatus Calescibacterium sp.]